MTKQSPGVRISNDVWRKLQHLKADTGKSIGKLVEEAVDLLVEREKTAE